MKRHITKYSGFTLIELMVAIAVIAIVTAIGLPSYREYIMNLQIKNAAESVTHGIQLARTEAIRRNQNVRFTLNTSGPGWKVCTIKSSACDTDIQITNGDGATAAIVVTAKDDKKEFDFDGLGGVTTSSTYLDFESPSMPANKTRGLRVTIDAGGIVRMCDPKITDIGNPQKCT